MSRIRQINKVLVANRGEIAVRIFRTLHQMGISSVAVYTEPDATSLHVMEADERYRLKGETLSDTYLNHRQLIDIALESDATAIHPGYGFLSEDPEFARAVSDAGLIFIGPGEQAIRAMGNKSGAREIASELGIPVIEGASGSISEISKRAEQIGFPIMVKAVAGGGGKGMRIAGSAGELVEVLESASREASSYFGNGEIYIEKYLDNIRHIEIQILADNHYNVVTLFERECSLQRRNQKIIEEAPAPGLSEKTRGKMTDAACRLARRISYSNAGTVEFLVSGDSFYFLEMNTRIQVEHPVTEMITGIDIVREQLNVAMNRKLSIAQEDIRINGHSIEARIYAEDPENDFLPSPGKVLLHKKPEGKGLRVDTALDRTGNIDSRYDPMVSKVIYHASNRETARKKLVMHLKDYVLLGVKANIAFLIKALNSRQFINGKMTTKLASELQSGSNPVKMDTAEKNLLAMAFLFSKPMDAPGNGNTWQRIGYWRLQPELGLLINDEATGRKFLYHNQRHMSIIDKKGKTAYQLIYRDTDTMRIDAEGHVHTLYYMPVNGKVYFQHEGQTSTVSPVRHLGRETLREINKNPELEGESQIRAPMHGTVIKINVKQGERVNKGDVLMILESMKMENKICATAKAYIKSISVNNGDIVEDNTLLVSLSDKLA